MTEPGSTPPSDGGWAAPGSSPGSSGNAEPPAGPPPSAAPPYYQAPPGGAQGWGTPILPPDAQPPPAPPGTAAFPGYPGYTPGGQYPSSGGWDTAVKPGVAPLRPLTTGEVLDGALTTLRRYPRAVLVPALAISVVETLLALLIQALTNRSGSLSHATGRGDLATVLLYMVYGFGSAVLASLVAAVVQRGILGQPITLAEAWGIVRPRTWTIIGAALLATLAWALALVTLVGGIYLYVAFRFATVVLVIEGGGVRASLGRSRRLVSGAWWRTFGLLLLVSLVAGIVSLVVEAPFSLGAFGDIIHSLADPHVSLGSEALADVGRLIAGIFAEPFTAAAVALLYIDRRMRVEGLDVALRQAAGA